LACTVWQAQAAEPKSPDGRDAVVLSSVEGTVEFVAVGSTNWVPARLNQVLYLGDGLRVGDNSRATLRNALKAVLRLGPRSEFRVEAEEDRSVFRMLKGLFFIFRRDKANRTLFQTPTASAATRGTEFMVTAAEDGSMSVSVLDGEVALRNRVDQLVLTNGQQGLALPGQAPTRTPVLVAHNLIQWCLYYPAVLNPDDLRLNPAEREALATSLAAYRSGNLVRALEAYPAHRPPAADPERIYLASLALTVGDVPRADALLQAITQPSALAAALEKLIAAVQFTTFTNAAPPATATEWLAESYYRQSRASEDPDALRRALLAAQAAVTNAPNFGAAWARLAELEFCFGRTDKARQALERALTLSPDNAQARTIMGFLLSAGNRIPEATRYFDQAIALDGGLGNAWLGRGLCRLRQLQLRRGPGQPVQLRHAPQQRTVPRRGLRHRHAAAHPGGQSLRPNLLPGLSLGR
jgi:tetratricopeptide (TPR) repeat protein